MGPWISNPPPILGSLISTSTFGNPIFGPLISNPAPILGPLILILGIPIVPFESNFIFGNFVRR